MARSRLGEEVQTRWLGRQLTAADPIAVQIPASNGSILTGIAWVPGDAGLLFLHDVGGEDDADAWGDWPDRFAALGYAVLSVDLPVDTSPNTIARVVDWFLGQQPGRLFIVAAGETAGLLEAAMADAFVLIAPRGVTRDAARLGFVPKLIIAGSAEAESYAQAERFARACRGWSPLSTFAEKNEMPALINGVIARQIGSQIASFLQEHRSAMPGPSRTVRRNPR